MQFTINTIAWLTFCFLIPTIDRFIVSLFYLQVMAFANMFWTFIKLTSKINERKYSNYFVQLLPNKSKPNSAYTIVSNRFELKTTCFVGSFNKNKKRLLWSCDSPIQFNCYFANLIKHLLFFRPVFLTMKQLTRRRDFLVFESSFHLPTCLPHTGKTSL